MQSKMFRTPDLWLSSYLVYRGINPQLEVVNDRVVFSFPHSEALYTLLAAFNMGDPVPLIQYIDAYKTLKAKMFNARLKGAEARP